ncbi:MAG: glycosyltransferase family 4 protein [Chloroflexota bacterium]|nr:glycosyltransferase family 4 protein [Chloroflexota bacterium]
MCASETLSVVFCRSNPIAPDPRVEKAASALAEAGYGVVIVGWARSEKSSSPMWENGLRRYLLPINAQYGTGLRNFPPLLRWQWGLLLWLTRHRRSYDIIHACDFDTVLPALVCKWLFGKKVVYDIFDFYADHLRATPTWIKQIIRWVDLGVIGQVDALVLSDEARWEQIAGLDSPHSCSHARVPSPLRGGDNRGGVHSGEDLDDRDWMKSIAVPNNNAVILNTPQDVRHYFARKLDSATVAGLRLVYVGLLQRERGLFQILQLLEEHPSWQLDLAGFGGGQERILDQAESLSNLRWHGRVPYRKALALTAAADVVVALYDPALPNHRYASPNKLFEAMMLAKPVIVARNTNIDQIVSRQGCGVVVEYGNLPELEQAVADLQADVDVRHEMGANGRRAYERLYSWSKMKARLLRLYTHL